MKAARQPRTLRRVILFQAEVRLPTTRPSYSYRSYLPKLDSPTFAIKFRCAVRFMGLPPWINIRRQPSRSPARPHRSRVYEVGAFQASDYCDLTRFLPTCTSFQGSRSVRGLSPGSYAPADFADNARVRREGGFSELDRHGPVYPIVSHHSHGT